MAEPPSSPPRPDATAEESLAWYKTQYEHLETDLAEFRESSRELEQELEKDIERAEKQERLLQERAETLAYEVEEWKRKYKESKTEAASVQNSLEKEITTLRDTNRTLQLKLRDIEVANDDFERQARNTTSSLEDMESKFNQAIERAVLMEEEIRQGEQERENMRIDAQRLREELSDLKIEAELLQDKVKKQEARHLSTISTDLSIPASPTFDRNAEPSSPQSTASSPLITTPPDTKSMSSADTLSELYDPPSPPMSDAPVSLPKRSSASGESSMRKPTITPSSFRKSQLGGSVAATPKPRSTVNKAPGTIGVPRMPGARTSTGNPPLRTPVNRSAHIRSGKLPASNSLTHIRTLTAQMERLEARVHNARSRLPAPTSTPPRYSPRTSVNGGGPPQIPSSITVRSRKRTVSSTPSMTGDDDTATYQLTARGHVSRLSESRVGRLSISSRPPSRTDMALPRPMSRSSLGGTRTPLGRPRSSMGGTIHHYSASVGVGRMEEEDEGEEDGTYSTPSRRAMYASTSGKFDPNRSTSSIPIPGSRRQSGSTGAAGGRRASRDGSSGIPVSGGRQSFSRNQNIEDLGETY
ncbi:NUDE protein, C-terminal conserved region [Geosmithia morbida]|uniref:NUDE protein, C-terminal conserved region n=1 Tax=Geosmithia morbida TaxID=1094350 RepID=A0A9P4YPT4_9HYPO|nr:NUDE protein, C-terminal conserved region [Geosmithia morbida]KAF4119396.1 NUDE protein, C-terminal conserved region [Geosmithia morbida]